MPASELILYGHVIRSPLIPFAIALSVVVQLDLNRRDPSLPRDDVIQSFNDQTRRDLSTRMDSRGEKNMFSSLAESETTGIINFDIFSGKYGPLAKFNYFRGTIAKDLRSQSSK